MLVDQNHSSSPIILSVLFALFELLISLILSLSPSLAFSLPHLAVINQTFHQSDLTYFLSHLLFCPLSLLGRVISAPLPV